MKNESVSQLLETGEIQMTEDVAFMIETVISMFERGMDSDATGQFIGYGLVLLDAWRDSLDTNSGKLSESDQVIANIMTTKL